MSKDDDIEFAMLHCIEPEKGDVMKSDKANTMDCPFVARKCRGDRCMAWATLRSTGDGCIILASKGLPFRHETEEQEARLINQRGSNGKPES